MDPTSSERQPPSTWAEELAARHRTELLDHARCMLFGYVDCAEDLVAETVYDIATGEFDSKRVSRRSLLPFAKRVIAYKALHFFRRERRLAPMDPYHRDPKAARAWDMAWRARLRRDVTQALDRLPPGEERAVRRHHLEGWSVSEIAEEEDASMDAIWQRLSRGRRKLGRLLTAYKSLG